MKKILIIDDSLLDRKLLMKVLEKAEVKNEIIQASDGEEGLKYLSEQYKDICLILLDWQMPNMNGLEFMKATRKVDEVSGIPIIMITASGSDDSKKIAYTVNPDLAGYVVKPYKPDEFITIIKLFIE